MAFRHWCRGKQRLQFLSSGDKNSPEPFRRTKDSDSSDPTVVGHYEGKKLVDFITTGEQWKKEKSVNLMLNEKYQW